MPEKASKRDSRNGSKKEAITEAAASGWQTEWTDRSGNVRFSTTRQATLDGGGEKSLLDFTEKSE